MLLTRSLSASSPRRRLSPWKRLGAATVELAMFSTLLGFMTLGMIELGRALMVRQVLTDAARNGARTGIKPGKNNTALKADANVVLTDNGINSADATYEIKVNDVVADASTANANDKITVKITLPVSKVLWLPSLFMGPTAVESETIVMMRQG